MGFMMGLLPCGLSYGAFARALPSGGPVTGGLLVLAFGLGTLPGLLLLGTGAGRLALRFRKPLDILSGLLLLALSASLGARALEAMAG